MIPAAGYQRSRRSTRHRFDRDAQRELDGLRCVEVGAEPADLIALQLGQLECAGPHDGAAGVVNLLGMPSKFGRIRLLSGGHPEMQRAKELWRPRDKDTGRRGDPIPIHGIETEEVVFLTGNLRRDRQVRDAPLHRLWDAGEQDPR